MKRDMDLIRKILLECEAAPSGWAPHDMTFEIGFHVYLLVDAGLMVGHDRTHTGSEGPEYLPSHMTWAGYEFLEAAKNDTAWAKAKSAVGAVGGLSFEVLKNVLMAAGTAEAMKKLGLGH